MKRLIILSVLVAAGAISFSPAVAGGNIYISRDFATRGQVLTQPGPDRVNLTELIGKARQMAAKAWVITSDGPERGRIVIGAKPEDDCQPAKLKDVMKRMAKVRRWVSYLARGRKPHRAPGSPKQIAEELRDLSMLSLAFKPTQNEQHINTYYSLLAHVWLQAQELIKNIGDTKAVKEIYQRLRTLEREGHKLFRKSEKH